MATHPRMVYRARWYAVAVVVITCILLYVGVSFLRAPEDFSYRASDAQLDLAVVAGIKKVAQKENDTVFGDVRAVVVPHHLVATEALARGVSVVTRARPNTVILISPDHFQQCPTYVCTTYGHFTTFFGTTHVASGLITQARQSGGYVSLSHGFITEHGVFSIVPYIAHYAPDARIVPFMLSVRKNETRDDQIRFQKLVGELMSAPDTVLVVSSDFSHYLTLSESDVMDALTTDTVCSGDIEKIRALLNPQQSDCPQCLATVLSVAQVQGFSHQRFLSHTNAARLLHDVATKETTSHFVIALGTAEDSVPCGQVRER